MKYFFSIVCLVSIFGIIHSVDAARLRLETDPAALSANGSGPVRLLLDAEGQPITALAATVRVSGSFSIARINDGDSIISTWIERPRIADATIGFSGIFPGGFQGVYTPFSEGSQPGVVMSFDVVSNGGSGEIKLEGITAYGGADGEQALTIDSEPIRFETLTAASAAPTPAEDTVAPTDLSLDVLKFDEPRGWFAIFSAVDSDSGIDRFEVQEIMSSTPSVDGWREAASPYRLEDQGRRRHIFVRAMDRSGNTAVIFVSPQPVFAVVQYIIAGSALILILIAYVLYRRRLHI